MLRTSAGIQICSGRRGQNVFSDRCGQNVCFFRTCPSNTYVLDKCGRKAFSDKRGHTSVSKAREPKLFRTSAGTLPAKKLLDKCGHENVLEKCGHRTCLDKCGLDTFSDKCGHKTFWAECGMAAQKLQNFTSTFASILRKTRPQSPN